MTRVVELFPEDIATSDVVTRVKSSHEQRPPPDLAFDENDRSSLSGSDFGQPKGDQAFAEAFLALRAALKVVTAQARPLQDKECGREKAARKDAFDLCFKVIDSDGEPPSGAQCTSEERAELRLTGVQCPSSMLRQQGGNRELSASRYASLASVLVDRDDVVRNEFARKLSQAVSSGQASFAKWAGALVLVALAPATGSEEKEEKRKAVAMAPER